MKEREAKKILKPIKDDFEKALSKVIDHFEEKSPLTQACGYALSNGGKRLRPIITLITAEAIGKDLPVMDLALSVEFFHTASLLADDLPCMDDEKFRRDKITTHEKFGESTALLASYTLIAMGYEYIYKASQKADSLSFYYPPSDQQLCLIALEKVSVAAGCKGAVSGQYWDLQPVEKTLSHLETIILRKTATLYDIAFSLGWLYGGGDQNALELISKCANHFGMAFQIADDMQDADDENKSNNFVRLAGTDQSVVRFWQEVHQFEQILQRLGLETQAFEALSTLLKEHMEKAKMKLQL